MDNNKLEHVGVIGMKWGHRKGGFSISTGKKGSTSNKSKRLSKLVENHIMRIKYE